MPYQLVENGDAIKTGNIYIARPNQHMLVKDNQFILGGGPEENRFRPSIDVLFRSAAVAYTSHAIGIILSGLDITHHSLPLISVHSLPGLWCKVYHLIAMVTQVFQSKVYQLRVFF